MSASRLAQWVLGLTFAALGALNLVWGVFVFIWTRMPQGIPGRALLVQVAGAIGIALGLGLLVPRLAKLAALLLVVECVAWMALLRLPQVVADPTTEVHYEELGESLILIAGTWALLATVLRGSRIWRGWLDGPRGVRVARLVLGLALPGIGISHFVYAEYTAKMIPGWIPFHLAFVYLTGAGHFAAGLGLLSGVLARLAATAEAAMITIFAFVSNLPLLVAQPGSHGMWVEFLGALIMAAACWAVAGSFEGEAWGVRRPTPHGELESESAPKPSPA